MITFKFRINHSFLLYSSHPVTVPRSQVNYRDVEELLCSTREAWVSLPGIGAYRGIVYFNHAGYGPYYQIRFTETVPLVSSGLEPGEMVQVLMFHADQRMEVHIRRLPVRHYPTAA